jgi:small subunit ribosomal protein S1
MVDRNLIREFQISDEELDSAIAEASGDDEFDLESGEIYYPDETLGAEVNEIITGRVIRTEGDEVLVDIGFKSEGIVPKDDWRKEDGDEPPKPGDLVEVLLEDFEDEWGVLLLSRQKAIRIRQWESVISKHGEGDVVTGRVLRKIKGGLLVDIGVNVFLPASQVDIRRPRDIGDYVDKDIECQILKVDESRRNIVVSRRKLIEDRREKMKKELLNTLEEGQLRQGVVKNIADFGAFVDLGGIDGLLHITDMAWERISHPSEIVKIEDRIEVVILNIDREKEKIALGLKQKGPNPWQNVADKYPIGTKHSGEVVNVMSYGAFVKLEPGIEGLVHISEMSWVKRINHPTELVNIGDIVDVVVLGINTDKEEISLGIKQTQANPWDEVAEKFPPGTIVNGTVRNLTNYGAFIELEEGIDGLLHVSDMSWVRKVSHANEMFKKGDEVRCQVLSVDTDRKRIALGLKQLDNDPWETTIPDKYAPGQVVTGKVTKITNFGVFVELEPELEGLLHVSELADHKVENPEDEVTVGQDLEVRILRVDTIERKIGLSRRLSADEEAEAIATVAGGTGAGAGAPKVREVLKGGTAQEGAGPLFQMPTVEEETAADETVADETATDEPAAEATPDEPAAEAAREESDEKPEEG